MTLRIAVLLGLGALLYPFAASASAASVSPVPSGPSTPTGGWSVQYADAFGAPLGIAPGNDNTLRVYEGPGYNSDEMEVFRPSAVSVGPEGLRLSCTFTAQEVGGKHYVCGS